MADDFGRIARAAEQIHLPLRPCGAMGHVENALEESHAIEVFGHGQQGLYEFLGDLRDGFEVVRCGIDELCPNAVARRVPLVLSDEHGVAVVLIDSLVDLIGQGANQTLDQCDQPQGVVE